VLPQSILFDVVLIWQPIEDIMKCKCKRLVCTGHFSSPLHEWDICQYLKKFCLNMTNSQHNLIQTVNLGMCIYYIQLSNTVVAEVTVLQSYDWRQFFRQEERREKRRERGRSRNKRKKGTRGGRKRWDSEEDRGWKIDWKQKQLEDEVSGHSIM